MEDVDYITISDDDEVEVLEHFIRCEPIIVDLTSGDTSKKSRRILEERQQPADGLRESSQPQRPLTPPPEKLSEPTQPAPPPPPPARSPQPAPPQQQQRPTFSQQPPQPPTPPPEESSHQARPPTPEPERLLPHVAPKSQNEQQPQQQKPQKWPKPSQPEPVKRTLSDRELMIAKKEQGNKKFRHNAFDEAVRCYREAIDLSRKLEDKEMTAILHFNLAMSYDKLGSYAQAADECAAAVKINDQYIKAHVKRAEIYMARGKYEEAVICYEHICEIDSTKRNDAMQRISKAKVLAEQMRKPDQYEILSLRPHFTAEQLKTAYKQKARAHHPDRHSDADVVTRRIHEKIFKEASEANTYFRKRFNFH